MREFQRVLDKDESKTLKYQMLKVAGVFNKNLNRLNCEWSNFVDQNLMEVMKKYYHEHYEKLQRRKQLSILTHSALEQSSIMG